MMHSSVISDVILQQEMEERRTKCATLRSSKELQDGNVTGIPSWVREREMLLLKMLLSSFRFYKSVLKYMYL